MSSQDYNEAVILAVERGYLAPELWGSSVTGRALIVYTRDHIAVNWVDEILAPKGLATVGQRCNDWREARWLLGLVPPARE